MNKKLQELIVKKTVQENQKDVLQNIDSMICSESEVSLDDEALYAALEKEGEFFILKAKYEDFDLFSKNEPLDTKLNEALSITICFEDDGNKYEKIEAFVKYIYSHTTQDQKFVFGVKRVDKLSDFPIKILLSEIYPINQLEIHLGRWIANFIDLNEEYFKEHFAYVREKISQEIGIKILPLNRIVGDHLRDNEAFLVDSVTQEKIVAFSIDKCDDKKALDIYLLKIFYIFLKLGAKYKH